MSVVRGECAETPPEPTTTANGRLPVLAATNSDAALSAELRRWHSIHQARTVVSVAAFVLAILGVAG